MSRKSEPRIYPLEDFVQALISQLDDVQDALALKVKTGRPLTWAIKDVALDLEVFLDVTNQGTVTMRNAAPNEEGSSTLRITLSTITRQMIEENTYSFSEDEDPRSLSEFGEAAGLDDAQRRRLARLGVRTVGQLKRLTANEPQQILSQHSGIPSNDLMRALMASSRPTVMGHSVEPQPDGESLVRLHGANLFDGVTPEVLICGEAVEVLKARPQELLVRPLSHHEEGPVEVFVSGQRCTGFFRLPEHLRTYGRRGARGSRSSARGGPERRSRPWSEDPWADRGGLK